MEPFFDQQIVGEMSSFWKEENLMSVQNCGKIVEQQKHHLALWGDEGFDTNLSFLNC